MAPRKSAFWSHVKTLCAKDLTILLRRHLVSTLYTALLLPILVTVYLGVSQNLQDSGNEYGIAQPRPVLSLEEALQAADDQRTATVFANNGLTGGDIDRVIDALEDQVTTAGGTTQRVENESDVARICNAASQRSSSCYGAVIFNSSPDQGGSWNYTIRGDTDIERRFDVGSNRNGVQIYTIPLQRAVDTEIARLDSPGTELPPLEEWPFTAQTEDERQSAANRVYQNSFVNFLGVAVLVAFCGITIHLSGHVATEREKGLSQLVDAMMYTSRAWEAQAARMISYFSSFSLTYLPGWIAGALILKFILWSETSVGVVLPYFILAGLAATAQTLLGGCLFHKAQLSGATIGLLFLLLGVLAQAVNLGTGPAVVLGLLFAPCNMILQIKYIARYEADGSPTNLLHPPEGSDHSLPALALWFFLLVQICVFPVLAAGLERWLHGAAADRRISWNGDNGSETQPQTAVDVQGLTQIYRPSLLRRAFSFISSPRPATVAVNKLDLAIPRGQIIALLGANGSGKSTTLDAIAGIQAFSEGKVVVDTSGGVGVAPQKNVMWDELTVLEHVRFFNHLKNPLKPTEDVDLTMALKNVGLLDKLHSKSKTLSGGQKRKLQLGMMLTGNSALCCVDEVSSGIDPLARRQIWDILLAARGERTIILTTHFLDEADLLADRIVIMSKGVLRAEGSPVELKTKLGNGYRIHVSEPSKLEHSPQVPGVYRQAISDSSITYIAPSSELATNTIGELEAARIGFHMSGPTMEDVFLHAAEEYVGDSPSNGRSKSPPKLASGHRVSIYRQTMVLLLKRLTLLQTNWLPYLIAFLIPLVSAAVMQLLVSDAEQSTCSPSQSGQGASPADGAEMYSNATFIAGPSSALSGLPDLGSNISIETVDTFSSLGTSIENNRHSIFPGGFWLGSSDSPSTMIYRADVLPASAAVTVQNILSNAIAGTLITTNYLVFATSGNATGQTLQLAIIFGIALGIGPAFLSLYPTKERLTEVRSLQYSSGVRVLAQWASHLLFDFTFFAISAICATFILVFTSDVFWNPGYLIIVVILYAITAILLGYVFSLATRSQLGTWNAVVAYNSVGLAIYALAFVFIVNLSDATTLQRNILIAHYTVAAFFPTGSVVRSMLVSMNVFSQACNGPEFHSYPGTLSAYGAPILYLVLQSALLFGFLLFHESRLTVPSIFSRRRQDTEKSVDLDSPISSSSEEGLRIQDLSKQFDNFQAVDSASLTVKRGEVLALLGPNGAGKSTIVSVVRGDLLPSSGQVFVDNTSVTENRQLARARLGVCPQVDALDDMTAAQHLHHYSRLRGIANIPGQVDSVLEAVGLTAFRDTMASQLSGGNKRKLSLAIALTGNPSVILLDEPSSGLDAAAKRMMWRTLRTITPGRSILLTTHSMEEADTLADSAAILSKQILAMAKVEDLCHRYGDTLYVHLVSRTAPYATDAEMQAWRSWISAVLPEAVIEDRTFHGQMRFSVSQAAVLEMQARKNNRLNTTAEQTQPATSAMGSLLVLLEENKDRLGIAYHSASPTTLNEVFMAVAGQHRSEQEPPSAGKQSKRPFWKTRKFWLGF